MFEQAKQVGIRPYDVARLLDLNRITVSLWFNHHSTPHKLLRDRVAKLLDAISSAVDAGDLPVSQDIRRKDRNDAVHNVLVKHMDAPAKSDNQGVTPTE